MVPQTNAALADFRTRCDDFSVQLSHARDPLFWIRVETGELEVRVSDLMPGALSDGDVARALLMTVVMAGYRSVVRMTVLDIASGNADPMERASRLHSIMAEAARSAAVSVIGSEMYARGAKHDLCTTFDSPLRI